MSDNRKRATEIACEVLDRPKVIADDLFDRYDEDGNNALDAYMAWWVFLQRLRLTPGNTVPVWPACIPQNDTATNEGLPLIERHIVTDEMETVTRGLRALVYRSALRIERRVRREAEKQAAPAD